MPIPNSYPSENVVSVKVTFRNPVTKVLFDPTVVIMKYRDPSGNITTRTYSVSGITKDSTGIYHSNITVDQVGRWYYTWYGDGARKEAYFTANPTFFS